MPTKVSGIIATTRTTSRTRYGVCHRIGSSPMVPTSSIQPATR